MGESLTPSTALALRGRAGAVAVSGIEFDGAVAHSVGLALSAAFPCGTLTTTTIGCFAVGVLLSERHVTDALRAETGLLVGTGLPLSFTTDSTFAVETV